MAVCMHHTPYPPQVNFPVVGLDMRPYIGNPLVEGDWTYDLYAVSVSRAALGAPAPPSPYSASRFMPVPHVNPCPTRTIVEICLAGTTRPQSWTQRRASGTTSTTAA